MATNSANCKSWCITIVSAILVLAVDKGRPAIALIACLPVLVLFALDAYYLALERTFKSAFNCFAGRLQRQELRVSELFTIRDPAEPAVPWRDALGSVSVWPFYLCLMGATAIVWLIVRS